MRLDLRILGAAVQLVLGAPILATTIDGGVLVVDGTTQAFPDPLVVGATTTGGLEILNGGSALSSESTTVGRDAGASGSVRVDGAGSRFEAEYGTSVTIGEAGSGLFEVGSGGEVETSTITETLVVGDDASGSGHVVVTGAGSSWQQSGNFVIGRAGSGLFEALDGGSFSYSGTGTQLGLLPDATGRLRVADAGSTWVEQGSATEIGVEGFGAVEILDGATSQASPFGGSDVVLGVAPEGVGELWISGAGSSLSRQSDVRVGERGTGLLVLRDGGSLLAEDLSLGELADGSGTLRLEDPGSGFELSGSFYVGKQGEGRFEVRDGATAYVTGNSNAGSTYIGHAPGSSGTVVVEGPTSRWQSGHPGIVHFGEEGAGALEVRGGALASLSYDVRLGVGATGDGSLLVEGPGSRFEAPGAFAVGEAGRGDAILRGGATGWLPYAGVGNLAGSQGSVLVEGAGSEWVGLELDIGAGGEGSFVVRDAARIDVRDQIVLGRQVGGVGHLQLTGPGTRLGDDSFDPFFVIGGLGTGEVEILDGAAALVDRIDVNGDSRLRMDGGSSLTGDAVVIGSLYTPLGSPRVDLTNGASLVLDYTLEMNSAPGESSSLHLDGGSTASFADDIEIGTRGRSDVYVGGGSVLTSAFSDVGSGGQGSVVVEGPGSRWSSGRVRVANAFSQPSSSGSVAVRSGGVIETTGAFGEVWVGQITGALGSIEVDGAGSRWRANGLGIAGSTVSAGGGTGSARIADGGVFDAAGGRVAVWANGTLELDGGSVLAQSVDVRGVLEGDGSIVADVTNAGRIAPGQSPGLIGIDGDYTQTAAGVFEIEIQGAAEGEFDRIEISGDAVLAGVLSVHLFGDPFALAGTPLYFLEASSVSGTFASVQATGIDPGLLQLVIESDRAGITIVPEPATALLLALGLCAIARLRRSTR